MHLNKCGPGWNCKNTKGMHAGMGTESELKQQKLQLTVSAGDVWAALGLLWRP